MSYDNIVKKMEEFEKNYFQAERKAEIMESINFNQQNMKLKQQALNEATRLINRATLNAKNGNLKDALMDKILADNQLSLVRILESI